MLDLYLRFKDEAECISVLEPLGMTYVNEDGIVCVSQGGHQYAEWTIGFLPSGTDEKGETIYMWCINIRQIDMDMDLSSLDPYLVNPKAPRCVWY